MVLTMTPPSTNPAENPAGWTNPRTEKLIFRFRPAGTDWETIATDVGKHRETATPCMVRNMINWTPVWDRPHAVTKQPTRKQPIRLMMRLPTTSAMEPARRRQEPLASLAGQYDTWYELTVHLRVDWGGPAKYELAWVTYHREGSRSYHKIKSSESPTSTAVCGRPIVRSPVVKLPRKLIPETANTMFANCQTEISASLDKEDKDAAVVGRSVLNKLVSLSLWYALSETAFW